MMTDRGRGAGDNIYASCRLSPSAWPPATGAPPPPSHALAAPTSGGCSRTGLAALVGIDTVDLAVRGGLHIDDHFALLDAGFTTRWNRHRRCTVYTGPAGPHGACVVVIAYRDYPRVVVSFSVAAFLRGCNSRLAGMAGDEVLSAVRQVTVGLLPATTLRASRGSPLTPWVLRRLDVAVDFRAPVLPLLAAYAVMRSPRARRDAGRVGGTTLYFHGAGTRTFQLVLYCKGIEMEARGLRVRSPYTLGRLEVRMRCARGMRILAGALRAAPPGGGLRVEVAGVVRWLAVDMAGLAALLVRELVAVEGGPQQARARALRRGLRLLAGGVAQEPGLAAGIEPAHRRRRVRQAAFERVLARHGLPRLSEALRAAANRARTTA